MKLIRGKEDRVLVLIRLSINAFGIRVLRLMEINSAGQKSKSTPTFEQAKFNQYSNQAGNVQSQSSLQADSIQYNQSQCAQSSNSSQAFEYQKDNAK